MGVQMWLAQPEATRDGGSGFQHLEELPVASIENGSAQVLIGSFGGELSAADFDHPALGLDVRLRDSSSLVLEPSFEHGVVPVDRPIRVDDVIVEPGALALVPAGFESITLETKGGEGRVMVLGGAPLGEEVKMWWNFVARTNEEITEAWHDWQTHNTDRFGTVPSGLPRIDAPRPPWLGPLY